MIVVVAMLLLNVAVLLAAGVAVRNRSRREQVASDELPPLRFVRQHRRKVAGR